MPEQPTWSSESETSVSSTRGHLDNIRSLNVQPKTLPQSSAQSYRLSARTEEGIKATVTAAMQESSAGSKRWTIYKNMLRWSSLIVCAITIIGEIFVAIFDGAYFDTTFGIPLVSNDLSLDENRLKLMISEGCFYWWLGYMANDTSTPEASWRAHFDAFPYYRGTCYDLRACCAYQSCLLCISLGSTEFFSWERSDNRYYYPSVSLAFLLFALLMASLHPNC